MCSKIRAENLPLDLWNLHVLNLFQRTRPFVSTVANGNLEVSFSLGHIAATRWISLFPLPWSICLLHSWHPQCSQSISSSSSSPFILSFPQSISFCLPPSFISPYLFISFFSLSIYCRSFLPVCIKMTHLDPFPLCSCTAAFHCPNCLQSAS